MDFGLNPSQLTPSHLTVDRNGRSFRVVDEPVVAAALAEFTSGFEEGTLRLFDAVLPECDRMVDFGAYVGFTALSAATIGVAVDAFEASPTNHALLAANVTLNPQLASRIRVQCCAVGDKDGRGTLYGKGFANSGSSLHCAIERGGTIRGRPEAEVRIRDASAVVEEIGIDPATLLKIDIEGAEYAVVPAIAPLLSARKPILHLSFHPFNIVAEDEYRTALARLGASLRLAEALSCYRHIYGYHHGGWTRIDLADRMQFLQRYLLVPKSLPRIASAQYGFVDAWAFADRELPLADC